MALGNNNPLIQKVTGMLGDTVVFKDYDGKIVISKKPEPSSKPPSAKQLRSRRIFKVANMLAQQRLNNPEELERYKAIAKSRKSPNALTAARRDALRTIYANPSDFEELIAEATIGEAPGLPVTESSAASVHANAPANIFEALLAAGSNANASAGNVNPMTQQLADMTNALNHCLQELQKTMTKASEMLQAINGLNASSEHTFNTTVEQTATNNVAFIPGTTDTTKSNDTDTTVFVRTIDDPTFASTAVETQCIASLQHTSPQYASPQRHASPPADMPKHDHPNVDETPTSDITTPSEVIASSIPSPFTNTQTTAHVNDRRQLSIIKSSTGDVLANDFHRYYFPFPGVKQHISTDMLDKIAIIIQGNAPRVHYKPR
ncbi:hypothetical protein WBG78_23750 [Chryseolinea sp. T2]|uniref:hypothetical protein n=1 Tax=Chryseolinea sp. T2 TaxID=3129255 RepID=UPI0030773F9D